MQNKYQAEERKLTKGQMSKSKSKSPSTRSITPQKYQKQQLQSVQSTNLSMNSSSMTAINYPIRPQQDEFSFGIQDYSKSVQLNNSNEMMNLGNRSKQKRDMSPNIKQIREEAKVQKKKVKRERLSYSEERKGTMHAKYEFGRIIAHGMIGIVYLARDKSFQHKPFVCIKRMNVKKIAEKKLWQSIKNEIRILKEIRNIKNCITLIEIYWDSEDMYLVLPYYHYQDLYKHIQKSKKHYLPENKAQKIFVQLIKVLRDLSKKEIVHRDIKPENILIDSELNITLTDFGFAIKKSEIQEQSCQRVGTLEFYPYEMLTYFTGNNGKQCISYDDKVDIWSAGIVLYELLYGNTPFHAQEDEQIKANIRNLKFDFPHHEYPLAEDLLRKIFVVPAQRISLKDITKHKFCSAARFKEVIAVDSD